MEINRSGSTELESKIKPIDGGNHNKRLKKERRKGFVPRVVIDLRLSKHRRYLGFFVICSMILGFAIPVVAYSGYAYSESAEFCGTTCHTMAPQNTRYRRSLHSNVACTDCHVGRGASYYVKSKIEGVRELVMQLTGTYSRPIRSPVHNLRPARETCEECHTPTSFKDNIVKKVTHYSNDERNSPIVATFILKMGGWREQTGTSQGIHWHITNPVFYIAADEQRQVMLWVGVEQENGKLTEYFSRDMLQMAQTSFVARARVSGEVRKMDCIDCHNRAAHDIPPPEVLVDDAIRAGMISGSLPYVRGKSIELLKAEYASLAEANESIAGLADDYRVNMPEVYASFPLEITSAIRKLQEIYAATVFPEMNTNWETNPNNENHSYSMGCFRCHDGKLIRIEETGNEAEPINANCNLCHTVPIVGTASDLLIEAPVIVGTAPPSHAEFSWTIEHQNISEAEKQDCYVCHGKGFCNNGVCHNLSHPPDMLFSHAEEYRKQGNQVCYTCHQDISCSRCHPGGVIKNP